MLALRAALVSGGAGIDGAAAVRGQVCGTCASCPASGGARQAMTVEQNGQPMSRSLTRIGTNTFKTTDWQECSEREALTERFL